MDDYEVQWYDDDDEEYSIVRALDASFAAEDFAEEHDCDNAAVDAGLIVRVRLKGEETWKLFNVEAEYSLEYTATEST